MRAFTYLLHDECRIARRRDEFFRIRQFRRVYDRDAGKFTFNISHETHTKPTTWSLVVAEALGLGIDEAQKFKVLDAELKIGPERHRGYYGGLWVRQKRLTASDQGRP